MRRKRKIVLGVLCILAVLLGLFVFWQWDNIMVLASMGKHSPDELVELLRENEAQREAALADISVRRLTEEEKLAVKNGELSQEEAVALITGQIPASGGPGAAIGVPPPSPGTVPTASIPPKPTSVADKPPISEAERDENGELAELIGRIYVLEAAYTGELEQLLDSAIAEYLSLPPEQHTTVSKLEIGTRYIGVADAMEKRCDEQMAALLNQIEGVLVASGGDVTLVGEIKTAYQNEKSLTKNYYLSLYA